MILHYIHKSHTQNSVISTFMPIQTFLEASVNVIRSESMEILDLDLFQMTKTQRILKK